MWKQTQYGVLPFSAYSHNIKLAASEKDIKELKEVEFDPEIFIEEKLFT